MIYFQPRQGIILRFVHEYSLICALRYILSATLLLLHTPTFSMCALTTVNMSVSAFSS